MTADQREAWYVRERNGEKRMVRDSNGNLHPALPIIPLTEDLAASEEIPASEAPKPERVDMDRIRDQVRRRIKALGEIAIDEELRPVLNGVLRFAGKMVLRWSLEKKLTEKVMTKIAAGLAPLR
ncbi:unnamed protein product, partial [Ectocarpus fasciculatus]